MPLFLVDDDGFAGDFATLRGLEQMRSVPNTPLLQEFLRTFKATHEQALAIAEEVKDIPALRYVWALFTNTKGGVIVTDGVVEDDTAPQQQTSKGRKIMKAPSKPAKTAKKSSNQDYRGTLFCARKGAEAHGRLNADWELLVLKGSTAVVKEWAGAKKWPGRLAQRKKLIADGTLKKSGDFYEFTKDFQFPSPSAAACVILAMSANGLIEWTTEEGKPLKELNARPPDRQSATTSAHGKRGKPNRKYEVKADLNIPQLAKAGAALGLNIWCGGDKLIELQMGRGGLFWKGAHEKKLKRIPWAKFSELLNAYG